MAFSRAAGAVAHAARLQNQITWVKSITTDLGSTRQFKPVNSERFLTPTTEHLFYFTPSGDVRLDRLAMDVEYADQSNLARHNKSEADPTVPKLDPTQRAVHSLRNGPKPRREIRPPCPLSPRLANALPRVFCETAI